MAKQSNAKQNPVVKATKAVVKHVNVKAAAAKVDQIIGEVVYGDEPKGGSK